MTVLRITLSVARRGLFGQPVHKNLVSNMPNYDNMVANMLAPRTISSIAITRNIQLISKEKKNLQVINFKLTTPQDKPLVILISWLMAKRRHVLKYANFYMDQGFDVLNINVTPWQLLWPTKGSQVVAGDILKFLELNYSFNPLFLHGFSIAGYLWGEVIARSVTDAPRYDKVLNKIVGQVWDSAADITEIPIGVPTAVFPNNLVMQKTLKQYMLYHLRTFDKVATVHYIRSSQMFHSNPVRAPALFFVSKIDPVGAEKSNIAVRDSWMNLGLHVYWKLFENSPHVGHFHKYPQEYMSTLYNFMESLNLIAHPEKMQAKL